MSTTDSEIIDLSGEPGGSGGIEIRNMSTGYGGVAVVRELDLTVRVPARPPPCSRSRACSRL